jgi:hypothetical protein
MAVASARAGHACASAVTDDSLMHHAGHLRRQYDSLLQDLDRPISDSDLDDLSFASTDSCTGVELQQWEQMWSHVVSMISEVVPTDPRPLRSWTERRLSLVGLVSDLIRLVKRGSRPRPQTADVRESCVAFDARSADADDHGCIAGRLRDVESRLSVHLERQNRLIARLDESNRENSELLKIVKVSSRTMGERSPDRTRHRRVHSRLHMRELIRTTNAMQYDYQQMRRCSGKSPDFSLKPVSFTG